MVLGGAELSHDARPAGEGFVQPEIIPPLHGDEVAEPHVCHLVQDSIGTSLIFPGGGVGAKDVVFAVGDAADVFHSAGVEVGDEHLVVGAGEGVEDAESAVVVVEAAFGEGEDVARVEVGGEGFAAVKVERNGEGSAVLPGPGAVY